MEPITDVISENYELWDIFTLKEQSALSKINNYRSALSVYNRSPDVLDPRVSKFLLKKGFCAEYPDNKLFAVCLTHDVDEIYPPIHHTLLSSLHCLKDMDPAGLRDQIFWRFRGSPYRNFREIIELEDKYSAKSSFYFLATDRDIKRFRYNVEDIELDIGYIIDREWEVGLHGGYYAADDPDAIRDEKVRLERVTGQDVVGYRNHYLRLSIPQTWEILSELGFHYDTTLGYNDALGFRNGMCHPFKPFNMNTGTYIDILQIPLVIMDGTLFGSVKSYEEAWQMAKRLIDTVASCRGVLTLNWHSNNFGCQFRRYWPRFYEKILQYCSNKNAWMTSGTEICKWWQYNDS